MTKFQSYDKLSINSSIVLDLPHFEGVGSKVHDISRNHINMAAINGPVWTALPSGVQSLTYDGTTQYLECLAANSTALDFTGNYSLVCWINWEDTGIAGEIIIGRYWLDHNGWELYLAWDGAVNSLTLRHHHAGTLVPPITGNPRSACYSVGWERGVWCLLGVSRVAGGEAIHYRNGVPLTMVTSGLVDPESCNQDLVIGARYTKNATFYKGQNRKIRAWSRALTAAEHANIFTQERSKYGV